MKQFRVGNIVKHERMNDVAFEVMGVYPRREGIKVIGHFINIIASTPYVMAMDTFLIKREDLDKWVSWVPKELQ